MSREQVFSSNSTEQLSIDIRNLNKQLGDIHKMLRWLIAEMIHADKDVVDEMRLRAECNQPDITDILLKEK